MLWLIGHSIHFRICKCCSINEKRNLLLREISWVCYCPLSPYLLGRVIQNVCSSLDTIKLLFLDTSIIFDLVCFSPTYASRIFTIKQCSCRRVIEHWRQYKVSGKLAINVNNVDAKMLILWLVQGLHRSNSCHHWPHAMSSPINNFPCY